MTHKLLWEFDLQMDHIISTIIPYTNQQKKKKEEMYKTVDFAVPPDHRRKQKESQKKDKYLDLARELKKTMEHESDNHTTLD